MYNKIIKLNGTEYNLSSNTIISPEIERLTLQKMGIQTLAKTCIASKTVNDTVTLNCTATSGTAPFTVTFKKDGVTLATRTNVALNTPATPVTDTVTAVGFVAYSVDCVDSCTNPSPLSMTETCTVEVKAACPLLQMNFVVS